MRQVRDLTTRFGIFALAAVLMLAMFPTMVSAQSPPPPPDWSVSLAGRVWVATGYSNWNFTSGGIDPATDLRWRGVDGIVGEVAADVTWKRLVWMLSVGGTKLDDGTLLDEEFAKSDRQARFSYTRSSVDEGKIFYVNNDIGARVARWQSAVFGGPASGGGYVDAFVGYQYWREEYVAFGVQGSLFLPGLTVNQAEPSSTRALTHQYTRHSVRIGARAQVPLVGGLSLKALAAFSPWTHTEHEAEQHLQTDIRAPTISRANGGFGAQAELGLAYAVWRGLSAEAGFRYWYFDSGSGDVTTTSTNGIVTRDKLNEAITERYGPYVGLSWRF